MQLAACVQPRSPGVWPKIVTFTGKRHFLGAKVFIRRSFLGCSGLLQNILELIPVNLLNSFWRGFIKISAPPGLFSPYFAPHIGGYPNPKKKNPKHHSVILGPHNSKKKMEFVDQKNCEKMSKNRQKCENGGFKEEKGRKMKF